jgi:hypothetical protein
MGIKLYLAALLAAAVAAAPTFASAQKTSGPGVTDAEITIGNIMPYSGPASAYGVIVAVGVIDGRGPVVTDDARGTVVAVATVVAWRVAPVAMTPVVWTPVVMTPVMMMAVPAPVTAVGTYIRVRHDRFFVRRDWRLGLLLRGSRTHRGCAQQGHADHK